MEIINFKLLTVTGYVLFSSLCFVFLVQLYFLLRYYLKLALHKDTPANSKLGEVTIILPVRNVEEHIRQIVDRYSNQQMSDYQLLVINEYSEDSTLELLNVIAETNPRLKVTSLSQETRFSEKQAINIGLKGASMPWIIFVTPASLTVHQEWLTRLNSMLEPGVEAVIAYCNVERGKGFRNLICRMERFLQFMISGSWTLTGSPFTFNENNVLFKKSIYFDTLGFRHKLNRNFANLELIFNENFKKGKVKLSTCPETTLREHIEDDRGDHIRLLKKTVQIRQSLSWSKKISLFVDDLSRVSLLVLPVVLSILYPEYWITILVLPVIFLILFAVIVNILLRRLNERKIFLSSLVYILVKPVINWWFFWFMYLIHRRDRWN